MGYLETPPISFPEISYPFPGVQQMGNAQRNVSSKNSERGGERATESSLLSLAVFVLFFFPPLFFSLHPPLPKCPEQARDFEDLHLYVESPVGWGNSPVKGRVEEVAGPLMERSRRGRSLTPKNSKKRKTQLRAMVILTWMREFS